MLCARRTLPSIIVRRALRLRSPNLVPTRRAPGQYWIASPARSAPHSVYSIVNRVLGVAIALRPNSKLKERRTASQRLQMFAPAMLGVFGPAGDGAALDRAALSH
jgi:hypothetical protein